MHAVLGAAAEADEPLGVSADRRERDGWGNRIAKAPARWSVSDRQQATEILPAARAGDQQRQVTAVVEAQLGTVERPQAKPAGAQPKTATK